MKNRNAFVLGLMGVLLGGFQSASYLYAAESEISPAWKKQLKKIPFKDRQTLIWGIHCSGFGGDEFTPDMQKEWDRLECDAYEREAEALRRRLSGTSDTLRLLNCLEETIEARNCPD